MSASAQRNPARSATAPAGIALERYPLHRRTVARDRLVRDGRAALAADGAFVLPGFITAAAVDELLAEVEPLLERAFHKPKRHNPWLRADDPRFGSTHPRNATQRTSSATVPYDALPAGGALDRIYRWPALIAFVAELIGEQRLYPHGDALSPVNVLVYPDGAQTGWHFDGAEFTVTLVLRAAGCGGRYEYAPFVRDDDEEATYERVAAVLDGRSGAVKALRQPAGALTVFRGARTLHRVAPAFGAAPRLVAVFSYAPRPDHALDAHTCETFYGRRPLDAARGHDPRSLRGETRR